MPQCDVNIEIVLAIRSPAKEKPMHIFLSHANEDGSVAEEICCAIRASGHSCFFGRHDLPAGFDYHSRIRQEIKLSDVLIFLVNPNSIEKGSYALTELRFAKQKWASPTGRILPVLVRPTDYGIIDPYLASVTVLEPAGNAAAEKVAALDTILNELAKTATAIVSLSVAIERL